MKLTLNLIDEKSDLLGLYLLERIDLRFRAELNQDGEKIGSGLAWMRNVSENLSIRFEIANNDQPQPDLSSAAFTRTWPEERWLERSPGLMLIGTLHDGTALEVQLEIKDYTETLNFTTFNFQVVSIHSTLPQEIGLPPDYCRMWLYCHNAIEMLAFNPHTTELSVYEKTEEYDGDNRKISGILHDHPKQNRFSLEADGLRYEVFKADDLTIIDIYSNNTDFSPSPASAGSILSGLSFLQSVEFRPSGYCVQTSEAIHCYIYPQTQFEPLGKPPLPGFRKLFLPPNGWDDCWVRLLKHWLAYRGQPHPYTYIRPLLHSAGAPFDVQAQVLTAMIEGFSRVIVKGAQDPNAAEIKDSIKIFKKFLKQWRDSKTYSFKLSKSICDRISGAMGRLHDFSAKDAIKVAAQKLGTAASEEELRAWKKLRDVRAHGSVTNVLAKDDIDNYHLALVLFYRLCLKHLKYAGRQQAYKEDAMGDRPILEI